LEELNKKRFEEWKQQNNVDCNFYVSEEQKSDHEEKDQADNEAQVVSESNKPDIDLTDDKLPKNDEETQEKTKTAKGPKIDNDVLLKI
jgi:hypothetical protein